MIVYQTNTRTGEYICPVEADESPLEPGVFLIPAGAYEDKPPRNKKGHAIFREGDKWVHKKSAVEEPVNEGLSQTNIGGQVRDERNERIQSIEWRLSRFERQERLGVNTTDSEEWYKNALKYVQELRDVPSQKGFPSKVKWPELKEVKNA